MYKYIGIRGHRGSGKSSIALLIASILDTLKTGGNVDDVYGNMVDCIHTGKDCGSFHNVYIETFSDTPITLIHMIFGIPMEDCYDDWKKDNMFINLKTYEYTDTVPEERWNATEYFEKRCNEVDCEASPHKIKDDVWFSLRELISYYGNYVMKYFFGANVWIKSMNVFESEMEEFYTGDEVVWKIYSDVKFTSEVDFIKKRGGIIINLKRPHKDKGNLDTSTNLKYDKRIDFELEYDEIGSESTMNKIKEISTKIYEG